jgi:succinate dehydrogenase/fumarate reductase flavoprotein subunit
METQGFECEVLVIGGGLAGAWSAIAAARAGARVILADKGYVGTSGVTAAAGPGHWWVPPQARDDAIRQRMDTARGLGEADWMARILDLTWRTLPTLAPYYRFPRDDAGEIQYRSLRGPEYLRALRRMALDLGVRILDHHPALELLRGQDGAIIGAGGVTRPEANPWRVRAGAVVLATGGCAFASRLHGSRNNTGDGHLMAAEAGADFSGMEFSAYYTVGPATLPNTRSMLFSFARYFDAAGRELDIPAGERAEPLAEALLKGPVFCSLDRTPADIRAIMPSVQPNFMLGFDRAGVDPYSQRFEVTLLGEGTIRGVGGLRVGGVDGRTEVSGLYAAGDVASREPVTGAISGGGAVNSAWALSSGQLAGEAAARFARANPRSSRHRARALGRAGLRPARGAALADAGDAIATVRDEMNPYDKNLFRSRAGLVASQARLEDSWREISDHGQAEGRRVLSLREAASLIAVARWCVASALSREESRGMHHRLDAPAADASFARRQRCGGLDQIWTEYERPAAPCRANHSQAA